MPPFLLAVLTELRHLLDYSIYGWEGMIQRGGVIGLVLVVFAIVGLAIVIEKSFALRRSNNFNDDYKDVLLALKRANDDQIEYELHLYPPAQTRMIRTAHESRKLEKDDLLRELSAVANSYVRDLSRRLRLLGDLGRLAPLLGLLGTILAIMESLGGLSPGTANATLMSQGLSQALLTTAAGLIVGLPMIFFHNHLKSRVNYYAEIYEEFGHDLVRAITYPASVEFGDDAERPSADSLESDFNRRNNSEVASEDDSGEDDRVGNG